MDGSALRMDKNHRVMLSDNTSTGNNNEVNEAIKVRHKYEQ